MKIDLHSLSVYVMHYKPLIERRKNMINALSNLGIAANWITDWDSYELNFNVTSSYYREDQSLWDSRMKWQGGYGFRRLRQSEISLAIKHLESMKNVVANDLPYALFLEDDAIFELDFANKFNNYFKDCPDDFDFVFLGNGCNLRISNPDPSVHLYRRGDPVSKCTDSFLISKRACECMLKHAIPFCMPIDFEINNVAKVCGLKGYWVEPTLITQGSQNGTYPSEVQ